MATVATFAIKTPPAEEVPFRSRAICPLPLTTDLTLCWNAGAHGNEVNFPIQSRVIGRSSKFQLVECITWSPPGTTSVTIDDAYVAPPVLDPKPIRRPDIWGYFRKGLLDLWGRPNAVRLRFTGPAGTEVISLSGGQYLMLREGRYMRTYFGHVRTQNYGGIHMVYTVNAGLRYAELVLNWHNGIPGPDVLFTRVELLADTSGDGRKLWSWKPLFNEDAIMDGNSETLVLAADHILPQRWERPFRVVLAEYVGDIPDAPRLDRGLGFHDWSAGGFLGTGLEMPSLSHIPVATREATVRTYLANHRTRLQGDEFGPMNDPQYGSNETQVNNEPHSLIGTGPEPLINARVFDDSWVVTHTSGAPTYVEGTDYVMTTDAAEETSIARIASGAITDGQVVHVDYRYSDPSNRPLSRFLPAIGVRGGGATSGVGIEHHTGVRQVSAQLPEGVLGLYIEQLRHRVRGWGWPYCDMNALGQPINIGRPATPENNLVNGSAEWAFDTYGLFLKQGGIIRDMPWNWKAHPRPAGPIDYDPFPAAVWNRDVALPSYLGAWDRYDNQHWIRGMRCETALAWLDGDPLAINYATADAEHLRAQGWNKPGRNAPLQPTPPQDLGWSNFGRGHAWGLLQVCVGATLITGGARRANLEQYIRDLITKIEFTQMPSGAFRSINQNTGSKSVKDPPFGDGVTSAYLVDQSFEDAFCVLAMAAALEVIGENFGLPGGRTLAAIMQDMGRMFRDLAWHTDIDGQTISGTSHVGPWKRYAVGEFPGAVRYATRAAFSPLTLCVGGTQVNNEAVVLTGIGAGDEESLANPRVIDGSVNVTHTSGAPTYTVGVDYDLVKTSPVGYSNITKIRRRGGGAIGEGQTVHVDYKWVANGPGNPPGNYDNSLEAFNIGDALGYIHRAGRDMTLDLTRFSGLGSAGVLNDVETALEAWGFTRPGFGNPPLENWIAALKEAQE